MFYAQIVFIALTIWALLLVSWVSFDAAREALHENALRGLTNDTQNFTKLERILLFPFLVLIFPLNRFVSLLHVCFGPKRSAIDKSNEKSNEEEDDVQPQLSQEKRNELKKQAEMLSQARIQYGAGSIEYKMLLDSLQQDVAGSGKNEQTQVAASSNAKERRKSTKVVPMSSLKKSLDLDLQTPKAVFAHFDKDDDQCLDKEEVRQAFQYLGCAMDDEKFEKMYSKCDKDKDGVINFKEFKKTL